MFVLEPEDTTAVIGETATLECSAPPSTPPAEIRWSQDSRVISNPRFQVLGNGSLAISPVMFSDQGSYQCTATNTLLGIARRSQTAILTAIGNRGELVM